MTLSDKTISRLWLVTAIVFLLLLAATVALVLEARSQPAAGVEALVERRTFLREEPVGAGRVDAVLRPGSAVTIVDLVQQSGATWYQVEVGGVRGWVPANTVTLRQ